MRFLTIALFTIFLNIIAFSAFAETRYVSDILVVNLRKEKGVRSETIRTLITGTAVSVLKVEGKFLKVRTAKGEVGYIHGQYLSRELPKATQIARLKKERDQLSKKLTGLEKEKAEFSSKFQNLEEGFKGETDKLRVEAETASSSLKEVKGEFASLKKKYAALSADSKHVMDIVGERDRLQQEHEGLLAEVETLRDQNAQVMRTGMIRWFLAGGGVFFVGWIAGKFSRKKKSRF